MKFNKNSRFEPVFYIGAENCYHGSSRDKRAQHGSEKRKNDPRNYGDSKWLLKRLAMRKEPAMMLAD